MTLIISLSVILYTLVYYRFRLVYSKWLVSQPKNHYTQNTAKLTINRNLLALSARNV